MSIAGIHICSAQQIIQGLDRQSNQPLWPSQEDYLKAKNISSISLEENPRLQAVFFSSTYQEEKISIDLSGFPKEQEELILEYFDRIEVTQYYWSNVTGESLYFYRTYPETDGQFSPDNSMFNLDSMSTYDGSYFLVIKGRNSCFFNVYFNTTFSKMPHYKSWVTSLVCPS